VYWSRLLCENMKTPRTRLDMIALAESMLVELEH
jgi:hypothetical protein